MILAEPSGRDPLRIVSHSKTYLWLAGVTGTREFLISENRGLARPQQGVLDGVLHARHWRERLEPEHACCVASARVYRAYGAILVVQLLEGRWE